MSEIVNANLISTFKGKIMDLEVLETKNGRNETVSYVKCKYIKVATAQDQQGNIYTFPIDIADEKVISFFISDNITQRWKDRAKDVSKAPLLPLKTFEVTGLPRFAFKSETLPNGQPKWQNSMQVTVVDNGSNLKNQAIKYAIKILSKYRKNDVVYENVNGTNTE